MAYLRQVCSQKVLCELLAVNPVSIGPAITETRLLLDEHRIAVPPTTLCFSQTSDLLNYFDHGTTA